jgi:hypothetical protein
MTQREQVFARAVVWRPSVLAAGAGGGLGWLIGIGSLAMGGVGPFIAAGPIVAALAGVAVGAAAEIRHDIAEKVGAILRAAAPQPTPSAIGPSACPLCCARGAVA